ncbi:MAG TPA: acyl-CoA dehydrogenase, partial [Myxococcota bacterium]
MTYAWILAAIAALALLYRGKAYAAWVGPGAFLLLVHWLAGDVPLLATLIFVAAAVVFGSHELRRAAFTSWLMPLVGRMLPRMGETERVALQAGTVWWDGELFSGAPDWNRLFSFRCAPLTREEQAFLAGPVEELCAQIDEWKVSQEGDLPEAVWEHIRKQRFFGMIIPKEYGGLGFSAAAHSAVVQKLSTRSVTAAVTVMVPNSLGPGELLVHYGTDEQKRKLLPRLASGEEIPCFALTGPEAGSDAAATQSEGVVCRGTFEGEQVLGMRLNWEKRYITLGPVSTLIGLAFKLRDPDHLLGDTADLGITCALIPSNLPGIHIGDRHDPMGVPFQVGPNTGTDVFVPLDRIIGGPERAGQGWRMLMESLAAGRSISLPSLSVGAAKLSARVASAYAMVREQFDTPIGRFEGVEEPLARIAGRTYMMDATRRLTVGAVDAGEKPAVLSAVAKAYMTDAMRDVVNDAMDIRAGAGIVRGPRNVLARAHTAVPIGITVEGVNILTRSMIIYGQGAIRCHPFAHEEIEAVAANDLARFDRAFFGHLGF